MIKPGKKQKHRHRDTGPCTSYIIIQVSHNFSSIAPLSGALIQYVCFFSFFFFGEKEYVRLVLVGGERKRNSGPC